MTLPFESKVIDGRKPEGRALLRAEFDSLTPPRVFTNGVFDLLHRGHVTLLSRAASEGKSLVVALNGDESVRRLNKGPDRPINCLEDRMAVIASLEAVSLVTCFDEDTPEELIEFLRPEVVVKGGDWALSQIVGGRQTEARGGRVLSIAFEHQRSTTNLLKKIRDSDSSR